MGTLLLRSLAIVFGSTCTAFALVNAAESSSSGFLSGYLGWLGDVVTLDLPSSLWDGLVITGQLALVGVGLGCVLAALLNGLIQNPTMERIVRSLLTPLTGFIAPVLVLTVGYWLGDRVGLLSDQPFEGFSGAPGRRFGAVVFPAIVLALATAPAFTAMLRAQRPALAEIGWASIAAPLAGRSTTHNQWTLGFPTGPLLLALAAVEPIAVPGGLFAQFVDALAPIDKPVLLGVVLIVVLGGVVLTLARDLVGHRFTPDDTRRLGGTRPRQEGRAGAIAFSVGMVGLAGFVIAALIAVNLRISESSDVLARPLSEGLLLGSDGSGRDLLSLAVAATQPVLVRALIPTVAATVFGTALALGTRALGRRGERLIETVSDLLWWPAPLIGLLAVRAFGHGDETLLIIAGLLVPFAMRVARREIVGFNAGVGRRFGGVVALVASAAFAIDTTIKFLRPPSRIDTGWGQQLAAGADVLGTSVWPALVAGTASLLFVTVLHLVGAYLISSGWAAWLSSPEAVIGAADLEAEEIAAAEAARPRPPVERPALTTHSESTIAANDDAGVDETELDEAAVYEAYEAEEHAAQGAPAAAAGNLNAETIIDLTDDAEIPEPDSSTQAPVYAAVGAADTGDGQRSVWSALQSEEHQFTNWADVETYDKPIAPHAPVSSEPLPDLPDFAELTMPPPPPPPTPEYIAPPPPAPQQD